jgi:hypothetical protein
MTELAFTSSWMKLGEDNRRSITRTWFLSEPQTKANLSHKSLKEVLEHRPQPSVSKAFLNYFRTNHRSLLLNYLIEYKLGSLGAQP